ncbi:MAG: helix-turn-helix domain-containing protein [Fimbriimonadaceae bacterium]
MNLADAIRQAAQHSGETPIPQPAHQADPVLQAQQEISLVCLPVNPTSDNIATSNVVRLELVLNPEQLSALLRAIVAGQHSVMTLREAAAYLRLPSTAVDQMATDGKLPALSIDGKWRFTHAALDEWMNSRQSEEHVLDRAVGA